MAADMVWGGTDSLSAVIKMRIGEQDVPMRARVTLLAAAGKIPVAEQWSDPTSGLCVFEHIDAARRYIALAEYPSNPDNPAAENYMRPVAGVSLKRGESGS